MTNVVVSLLWSYLTYFGEIISEKARLELERSDREIARFRTEQIHRRNRLKMRSIPLGGTGQLKFELFWNSTAVDLDLQIVAFNSTGFLVDACYYNKVKAAGGSLVHTGDLQSGVGGDSSERVTVNFESVPASVEALVVSVYSYAGEHFRETGLPVMKISRRATTDQQFVQRAEVALDYTGASTTGTILGVLLRNTSDFHFYPLQVPVMGARHFMHSTGLMYDIIGQWMHVDARDVHLGFDMVKKPPGETPAATVEVEVEVEVPAAPEPSPSATQSSSFLTNANLKERGAAMYNNVNQWFTEQTAWGNTVVKWLTEKAHSYYLKWTGPKRLTYAPTDVSTETNPTQQATDILLPVKPAVTAPVADISAIDEDDTEPALQQEQSTEHAISANDETLVEPASPLKESTTDESLPVDEPVIDPAIQQTGSTDPSISPISELATEPDLQQARPAPDGISPISELATEPDLQQARPAPDGISPIDEDVLEPAFQQTESTTDDILPVDEVITEPAIQQTGSTSPAVSAINEVVTEPTLQQKETTADDILPVDETITEPATQQTGSTPDDFSVTEEPTTLSKHADEEQSFVTEVAGNEAEEFARSIEPAEVVATDVSASTDQVSSSTNIVDEKTTDANTVVETDEGEQPVTTVQLPTSDEAIAVTPVSVLTDSAKEFEASPVVVVPEPVTDVPVATSEEVPASVVFKAVRISSGGTTRLPSDVVFGFGWNSKTEDVSAGVSCLLFDANGKLVETVGYANPYSDEFLDALVYADLETDETLAIDDATVTVSLEQLESVTDLFFVVNVLSPSKTLDSFTNVYVRALTDAGVSTYTLPVDESIAASTSVIIGRGSRTIGTNNWTFHALAEPSFGRTSASAKPSIAKILKQNKVVFTL